MIGISVEKLSLVIFCLGLCSAGLIPNFGKELEDTNLPSLPGFSLLEKISEDKDSPFSQGLPILKLFFNTADLVSNTISGILEFIFDKISSININNNEGCPEAETKLIEVKEALKEVEKLDEATKNTHYAKILKMTELPEVQMRKIKHFCPELTMLLDTILESLQNLKQNNEVHKEESEEKVEDQPEPDAVSEE